MEFSRYYSNSLDLTAFVVRGHGGANAELSLRMRWLSLADSLESGNLKIQESINFGIQGLENLGIWEQQVPKNKKL